MAASYRAFLSYSHDDARFARRFHADLEGWRVDRELVGRETSVGPVPDSLRPIFRDREDFASGRTVSEATRDALESSSFLIVLCSPSAAGSDYVNEEIRVFKAMGRADRTIPVIIAGEPGDPGRECFPDVLTREVTPEGVVTSHAVEPLAADARKQGDGRRRALTKVVAGLLGIPFDELARRAERAQRRRTRILSAVAGMMFVLAIAAGGFAWLSESRRVIAERNYQAALDAADSLLGEVGEELIRIEGITLATARNVVDRSTSIYDQLAASLPDDLELQIRRVPAMMIFANALSGKGDAEGAIQTLRDAESLAQSIAERRTNDPPSRALVAKVQWRLGVALGGTGDRDAAMAALEDAVATLESIQEHLPTSKHDRAELAAAMSLLSMLLTREGRLDEATKVARRSTDLLKTLASEHPTEWQYQTLLTTRLVAEAELLEARGKQEEAEAILAEAEDLLHKDLERRPDMPQVRKVLASVQTSRAMLLVQIGDEAGAAAAQQRSEATYRYLAAADAEDRNSRREHADDQVEAAMEQAETGATLEAAANFRKSLDTLEGMAKAHPDDWIIESSLETALSSASQSLGEGGFYVPAEAAARRLLELREARHGTSPSTLEGMESLSMALYLLARAVEGNGELEEALALRRRQLNFENRLAVEGPSDRSYLLVEIHRSAGLLAWRLSRREEALPYYERQIELLTALVAESPDDVALEIQLGQALLNLGELRALTGDGAGALAAFEQCLRLRAALVEAGHDAPQGLTDLAWAEARLAQFGDQPLTRWRRVEALLREADSTVPLGDFEDELLTVSRIALSGGQL